jgi:hypothetical protein
MTPDYRRIHELEFELGFRDDPPPSRVQSTRSMDAIVKEMWTQPIRDRPGQVIFYNRPEARPEYLAEELLARLDADVKRKRRVRSRDAGEV